MIDVIHPLCNYMTCIFKDKDTARSLMGTAVQTGGKQLGVHNISTVPNGDQIIKKKKKYSKTTIHIT